MNEEVIIGGTRQQVKIIGNNVNRKVALVLGLALRDAWMASDGGEQEYLAEDGLADSYIAITTPTLRDPHRISRRNWAGQITADAGQDTDEKAKEHIQATTPTSLNGDSKKCTPQREGSGWFPTSALRLRDVRKAEIREKRFEVVAL